MSSEIPRPHAPVHKLAEAGTFFVSVATYQKEHFFANEQRLSVLHRGLLKVSAKFEWQLEAWAVFSNHYHFVGHSPMGDGHAESLSKMLKELHAKTASWINKLDGVQGRQVWYNFRETRLTHQKSYLARLNYTHQNAVKHGLVHLASMYPWCSAGWFERTATPAQVNMIYGLKTELVRVYDEFEPVVDWRGR